MNKLELLNKVNKNETEIIKISNLKSDISHTHNNMSLNPTGTPMKVGSNFANYDYPVVTFGMEQIEEELLEMEVL